MKKMYLITEASKKQQWHLAGVVAAQQLLTLELLSAKQEGTKTKHYSDILMNNAELQPVLLEQLTGCGQWPVE